MLMHCYNILFTVHASIRVIFMIELEVSKSNHFLQLLVVCSSFVSVTEIWTSSHEGIITSCVRLVKYTYTYTQTAT